MTELDFDELDKAVNSLMGNVKDKDKEAESKTLDVDTTLAPDEAPAYDKLEKIAEKIDGETTDKPDEPTVSLADEQSEDKTPVIEPAKPVVNPAPVAQKSGRFMDVVHPSSDMRTKTPVANPVTRVGTTIAVPEARPVSKTEHASVVDTSESAPSVDVSDTTTASSELPPVSEVDKQTVASTEPLISPFLPDAKVDKRPLGGAFNGETDAPQGGNEEADDTSSESNGIDEGHSKMDVQSGKQSTDINEHIPEEFQDELLAVEQTPLETDKPSTDATLVAPASIPKQYQEKESTGDKSTGAIYDTDVYHKPLATPAKKKPILLWIMIVILIILLIASVGAALYFFGVF